MFFLLLQENICCGDSLEAPHQGTSNEHGWKFSGLFLISGFQDFCSYIKYRENCLFRIWKSRFQDSWILELSPMNESPQRMFSWRNMENICTVLNANLDGSVGYASAGDQEVAGSASSGSAASFVEIDHEIYFTVILSLPLIQEGQLSVSGERMCTILVNPLED